MTEEQELQLRNILDETWMRLISADEAFEVIDDLIFEIRSAAMRGIE